MDINFTITQGIGTPGDIEHFILDGLSANPGGGGVAIPVFVHHMRQQGMA